MRVSLSSLVRAQIKTTSMRKMRERVYVFIGPSMYQKTTSLKICTKLHFNVNGEVVETIDWNTRRNYSYYEETYLMKVDIFNIINPLTQ